MGKSKIKSILEGIGGVFVALLVIGFVLFVIGGLGIALYKEIPKTKYVELVADYNLNNAFIAKNLKKKDSKIFILKFEITTYNVGDKIKVRMKPYWEGNKAIATVYYKGIYNTNVPMFKALKAQPATAEKNEEIKLPKGGSND